ncbi:MAG TPA: 5'/3'-nucleotidase SurE [Acidobacteriota bacterium]
MPTILVTNDDGIHSEGLAALADGLRCVGRVVVVAPEREMSTIGHALTLHSPLRLRELGPDRYIVDGTPSDCVYLGVVRVLSRTRPDLLVSGINRGGNVADDITYSGTVSAAFEGTLLGIRSLAISLLGRHEFDFTHAARFAPILARKVLQEGLPPDTLLNVNVPRGAPTGVGFSVQGRRTWSEEVVEKTDPRGRGYFWIGGAELRSKVDDPQSDLALLARGSISITPLHLDLTNHRALEQLGDWDLKLG